MMSLPDAADVAMVACVAICYRSSRNHAKTRLICPGRPGFGAGCCNAANGEPKVSWMSGDTRTAAAQNAAMRRAKVVNVF